MNAEICDQSVTGNNEIILDDTKLPASNDSTVEVLAKRTKISAEQNIFAQHVFVFVFAASFAISIGVIISNWITLGLTSFYTDRYSDVAHVADIAKNEIEVEAQSEFNELRFQAEQAQVAYLGEDASYLDNYLEPTAPSTVLSQNPSEGASVWGMIIYTTIAALVIFLIAIAAFSPLSVLSAHEEDGDFYGGSLFKFAGFWFADFYLMTLLIALTVGAVTTTSSLAADFENHGPVYQEQTAWVATDPTVIKFEKKSQDYNNLLRSYTAALQAGDNQKIQYCIDLGVLNLVNYGFEDNMYGYIYGYDDYGGSDSFNAALMSAGSTAVTLM